MVTLGSVAFLLTTFFVIRPILVRYVSVKENGREDMPRHGRNWPNVIRHDGDYGRCHNRRNVSCLAIDQFGIKKTADQPVLNELL
jgi:hypothetical protein